MTHSYLFLATVPQGPLDINRIRTFEGEYLPPRSPKDRERSLSPKQYDAFTEIEWYVGDVLSKISRNV